MSSTDLREGATPEASCEAATRRRGFLARGATGFLLLSLPGCVHRPQPVDDERRVTPETVIIKNPAYLKCLVNGEARLVTHRPDGADVVYRVDGRGESVFDLSLNVQEYHDGAHQSADDLLRRVRRRYPDDDASQQAADFRRFLLAALEAGVLITDRGYVWSVTREARPLL